MANPPGQPGEGALEVFLLELGVNVFVEGSVLNQVANISHIDFMSDLTGRFRM